MFRTDTDIFPPHVLMIQLVVVLFMLFTITWISLEAAYHSSSMHNIYSVSGLIVNKETLLPNDGYTPMVRRRIFIQRSGRDNLTALKCRGTDDGAALYYSIKINKYYKFKVSGKYIISIKEIIDS